MSPPRSRREQQQHTREALILAGRAVFARDGYHQANLNQIAAEAGYSKGAVYSNFASKADLFLAALDQNIETSFGVGGWDVFERTDTVGCSTDATAEQQEVAALIRGMSLATLEFIASAARDEALGGEMAKRLDVMVEGYAAVADRSQSEQEQLQPTEIGALLAALDQGSALLALSGSRAIDQRILREGMRRLLTATGHEEPAGSKGEPAMHDEVIRGRIAAALSLRGVPDTTD